MNKKIIILFILGELMAFGFICLLQFINVKTQLVWFILTLVGMHLGIISFIVSKKVYNPPKNCRIHYYIEYILLALYLPFLGLKIFNVHIERTTKLILIFSLTFIVIIISIFNNLKFYQKLKEN